VGRNKKLREKIAARERNIEDHMRKIAIELAKDIPNEELIVHWQTEINEWETQRARPLRRLHYNW